MQKNIKTQKPLASEILKDTENVIRYVEQADVRDLRDWLMRDTHLPLICIGSGGKHTSYGCMLYETMSSVARTVTPLEFASMSPAVIQNSKILLLSSSGKNMDIKYAAKRAVKYNKAHTACITFRDGDDNPVLKIMNRENCFIYKNEFKDHFISVRGKFLTFGLLYKAFTGSENFADKLRYDAKYTYEINKAGTLPDLSKISRLCVLYGSYGEPVAREIDSVMAESGVASVQVCDYRNFCHGRFIFPGNHCENKHVAETDTCMVLLISPRERKLADGIRKIALADNMPVVEIVTEHDNALASIQLLYDALAFIFELAENHHHINPNDPRNYSGIDKRKPINTINYVTELEKMGDLVI